MKPKGLFQFCRMPVGLMNASGMFQKIVNDLTQVLRMEDIITYLDDFMNFHKTWEEHLIEVERILNLFKKSRALNLQETNVSFQGIASPLRSHSVRTGWNPNS